MVALAQQSDDTGSELLNEMLWWLYVVVVPLCVVLTSAKKAWRVCSTSASGPGNAARALDMYFNGTMSDDDAALLRKYFKRLETEESIKETVGLVNAAVADTTLAARLAKDFSKCLRRPRGHDALLRKQQTRSCTECLMDAVPVLPSPLQALMPRLIQACVDSLEDLGVNVLLQKYPGIDYDGALAIHVCCLVANHTHTAHICMLLYYCQTHTLLYNLEK